MTSMLREVLKNLFVHHPKLMNRTAPNPSVSLFVDLSKAYESVNCTALVAVLRSYEAHQLVDIIQELYTQTECHIRTEDRVSEHFHMNTGVRLGCVLSPLLFNCVMDKILKEATDLLGGSLHIEYTPYWRSLPLILEHNHSLHMHPKCALHRRPHPGCRDQERTAAHVVDRACACWGMQISMSMTKILAVEEQTAGQQTTNQPSNTLQGQALEQLESFSYLGSEVNRVPR